jgi:hypothetical protein
MNFVETRIPLNGIAEMFVCKQEKMKEVTHSLLHSYHSLCIDKQAIILAEIDARTTFKIYYR